MSDNLIERYFAQELSPEELAKFNRQLKEDADFAKAFQLEKDLMEGLEAMGNKNLRKDLKNIYQEEVIQSKSNPTMSEPNNIKANSSRRWRLVAASIAILGILGWLFWPEPSPQQLYAEYAKHEFNFVEKGGNDQDLFKAETALKAGKYSEAIPFLENHLKNQPNDYNVLLARGIAHLEIDDHEKAILTFRQLRQVNASYKTEGTWYLALAHLKGGNITLSQQHLKEVPEGTGRFAQAQELLGRLHSATQ